MNTLSGEPVCWFCKTMLHITTFLINFPWFTIFKKRMGKDSLWINILHRIPMSLGRYEDIRINVLCGYANKKALIVELCSFKATRSESRNERLTNALQFWSSDFGHTWRRREKRECQMIQKDHLWRTISFSLSPRLTYQCTTLISPNTQQSEQSVKSNE